MTKTKYAHLVKTMPIQKGPGGANATEIIWMFGKELEGLNLNFAIGRYEGTGVWHPWAGPHVHPIYDECLLFFGHDTNRLDYLGAEFEISLGKEQEKHVINTPSIVILPAGQPHCPLITKRIDHPFVHGHIILGPEDVVDWWPKETEPIKTDGSKYRHLVKPLKVQKAPMGAGELERLEGGQLEGFNLNIAVGVGEKTGWWYQGRGPHTHPYDECLIFFGHDPTNLGYLGAEIEIALGEEREKHTFNVPTVVVVPKGLPHFPLEVKKVERPFGFILYGLGPKYEVSWLG